MAAVSVKAPLAVPQLIVAVAALHGESRSSVSRKTGLSRREIAAVWQGTELPSEKHVALMVALFKVSADQLFRPERAPSRRYASTRGGG